MGYMLSELGHLPVDADITLYIFVIDLPFEDQRGEILKKNFPEIAKTIGSNAVIAMGFDRALG